MLNQRKSFPLLLALLSLVIASAHAKEKPIMLNTHELPPYSYHDEQGKVEGLAIRVTECALKKIKRSYIITFYPWIRAQKMVQLGLADGFFAASQSDERNQYAVLSATIAPQEWRWYLLKDNPLDPLSSGFKEKATVGSFRGSNMLDWLNNNNYMVEATPPTNPQLLKMLQSKRIDAILANKLVMDRLIAENGADNGIRSVLQQDKPLGIYFSKTFLAKQAPDFMEQMNRAITICSKK